MTRIALIAMLLPAFVYSTEAISAPILYRSQNVSNIALPTTSRARQQRAPSPNSASSNRVQRVTSATNIAQAPNANEVRRQRVVPLTNDLPRGLIASARLERQRQTNVPKSLVYQNTNLTPLEGEIFPPETFSEYMGAPFSSFNPGTAFKLETAPTPKQVPFKATLVGVNINAWLENPDMHKVLIETAEKFPIPRLLDNLVQNNPGIMFNNPELAQRLLTMDIYSPYLSNVTKPPKLPPLFTEYKTAVAFTRNYNIYGASAGGLPYFGTPTEGADRRINLSVNKHQFREYAVRLPDTDIFLVATINISPNWLEESWDIRQENRQFADIFIYAFNRKGKLLGGSGIGQFFIKGGQFITLSQRVYSKHWQTAIPRVFYITPSFKIVNSPIPGSRREPATNEIELSKRPYLNSIQRYILSSVENLQETHQKTGVQLFNEDGQRIYKYVIPPKNSKTAKPFLAKRKFILNIDTNSKPVFNYSPKVLEELEGTAPRNDDLPAVQRPPQTKLPSTKQVARRRNRATPTQAIVSTTNERRNLETVTVPMELALRPNQTQQRLINPSNTSSRIIEARANLAASNQGRSRRTQTNAPTITKNSPQTSTPNNAIPTTNQNRRRTSPTNTNVPKPSTAPLRSCTSSSEFLVCEHSPVYLAQADDFIFPLQMQKTEVRAQMANTNQDQRQRTSTTNAPIILAQASPTATNGDPRRASTISNLPPTNQATQLAPATTAPDQVKKKKEKATEISDQIEKKKEKATETPDQVKKQKEKATETKETSSSKAAATVTSDKATKTKKEKSPPKEKAKKLSPAEQLQQTEDKIQESREKKFTKDQAKLKKAMALRRYFPSNEEKKLKEMIETVSQRLKEAPYFTTNDLQAVTNSIPPFELETDPAVYRSERRKYYSIPTSTSRFKKQFAKETRTLKAALSARLNDELYWANLHRQALMENNNWSPSMETQHLAFKKQHFARKKVEVQRFIYHRDSIFKQVISNEIKSYLDRSQKYAQQTVKPAKQLVVAEKLQQQADTQLVKSLAKYQKSNYILNVSNFKDEYKSTLSNFSEVTKKYVAQKQTNLIIAYLQKDATNNLEQVNKNRQEWTTLAQRNRVPLQLVAFAEISKKQYPTKIYRKKMENAARREYRKNIRFIIYEGYIFVLSGKWKVKTSLADRLDIL